MNFPFNWIMPGEYNYCHRCGMYLVKGPKFEVKGLICNHCTKKPITMYDISWQMLTWKSIKNFFGFDIDRKHRKFLKERDKLAQSRKDAGMEPLFWMKK